MRFVPAVTPPGEIKGPALWFVFRGDELLVETGSGGVSIPRMADPAERRIPPLRTQYLGTWDGKACCSAEVPAEAEPPDGTSFSPLRPLLGGLPEEFFTLAGRAFQVMDWDRTHLFCGRCGAPTEALPGERARRCSRCGMLFYPRISPAVIVAVVRGDRILLARARRFAAAFHSVLAGFVEPGETFEECVEREVREEVGIEVANIRYFGSQPWPFSHSLMVGFTADHAAGEIVIDEKEIVEADWYTAADHPPVPRSGTIARRLIDWFAKRTA